MPNDDTISQVESKHLKKHGFEAGEVVYEFVPEFSLDDLKAALFDGTNRRPTPIRIQTRYATAILLVVESVRRIDDDPEDEPPIVPEQDDLPEWWVEGWLMASTFDSNNTEPTRARMHVLPFSKEDGTFERALIQRVPTDPYPDGIIRTEEWTYIPERLLSRRQSPAQ